MFYYKLINEECLSIRTQFTVVLKYLRLSVTTSYLSSDLHQAPSHLVLILTLNAPQIKQSVWHVWPRQCCSYVIITLLRRWTTAIPRLNVAPPHLLSFGFLKDESLSAWVKTDFSSFWTKLRILWAEDLTGKFVFLLLFSRLVKWLSSSYGFSALISCDGNMPPGWTRSFSPHFQHDAMMPFFHQHFWPFQVKPSRTDFIFYH